MKKLSYIILCALCTIAICLSTWSLIRSYTSNNSKIEYTLYIGTNDKDTFEPAMPLESFRDIISETMMNYFPDGFTIYGGNGVWKDENNRITLEYTYICVIEDANKEDVYKAADELIEILNQNTILIIENSVENVDFYTGS